MENEMDLSIARFIREQREREEQEERERLRKQYDPRVLPLTWDSRSTIVYATSPLDLFIIFAMFKLFQPRTEENFAIMFAIFLWKITTLLSAVHTPISQSGKLTLWRIFPFSRYSCSCLTAITAQFSSDSSVEAPRCGMTMQPGFPAVTGFGKSET